MNMAQSTVTVEPPKRFTFEAKDWPDWYADWKQYIIISEIQGKTDEVKISTLLYTMGTRKAQKIMQTFRYGKKRTEHPSNEGEYIEVDEKDSCYEDVIQKFNEHYVPRVDIVHESIVFNKRVQSATESVDDFLIDLEQLVLSCDYEDPERQVRDRFIAGLKDSALQEKLQFFTDCSLQKAINYARRFEKVQDNLKNQKQEACVDELKQRKKGWQQKKKQYKPSGPRQCERCGCPHGEQEQCPAIGKLCNYCKKKNHYARMCKKRKRRNM